MTTRDEEIGTDQTWQSNARNENRNEHPHVCDKILPCVRTSRRDSGSDRYGSQYARANRAGDDPGTQLHPLPSKLQLDIFRDSRHRKPLPPLYLFVVRINDVVRLGASRGFLLGLRG